MYACCTSCLAKLCHCGCNAAGPDIACQGIALLHRSAVIGIALVGRRRRDVLSAIEGLLDPSRRHVRLPSSSRLGRAPTKGRPLAESRLRAGPRRQGISTVGIELSGRRGVKRLIASVGLVSANRTASKQPATNTCLWPQADQEATSPNDGRPSHCGRKDFKSRDRAAAHSRVLRPL